MSLPFSPTDLLVAVSDGRVTAREHPTLPYAIFNYSPDVQYTNRWDDVTLNCRGLILDNDFNIVARPWKKFFNLGQVDLPIQFDDPVEVMDKVDGSLGILYPDEANGYSIATRGSFTSEQAVHATKIWHENYNRYVKPTPGYTFLFEIVYPGNRIVLDYGDTDDLFLLGAVENATGYYLGPREAEAMMEWPGYVVDVHPHKTISDALGAMDRKNAEGYVIRSHNFMVKLKQPDYLELHRLVTNASPKTVWEQLRAGKSKSEIVSAFPDEFHAYIGSMVDPLIERYEQRATEIFEGYNHAVAAVMKGTWGYDSPDTPTRAQYANVFKKSKDSKYYFLLLDNRSIRDVLWSELKPRETKEA